MKIYIDFDDVLCETAEYFTKIAKELFGIDVPYRQVQFFNLQKSFDLNDEQYEALMKAGHLPENLLNYEETPGASEAINKWVDQGHEVFIITGRPFNSYEPSRKWLDEHHLERVPLFCVDKYGRETAKQDYKYNMTLEELYNMTFDFAVEDSPAAFEHVIHFDNCRTAVFDRPWNSRAELPNDRFVRCKDWQEIDRVFEIEKRRMTYDKFLKAAPVVFLIGTMVTAILYQKTLLEIWLTIAITFGTTAYHFIMRWVVAFIYNSIMHNRADYRKHWYQVSKSEMKLYEKLRVKNGRIACLPIIPACLTRDNTPGRK